MTLWVTCYWQHSTIQLKWRPTWNLEGIKQQRQKTGIRKKKNVYTACSEALRISLISWQQWWKNSPNTEAADTDRTAGIFWSHFFHLRIIWKCLSSVLTPNIILITLQRQQNSQKKLINKSVEFLLLIRGFNFYAALGIMTSHFSEQRWCLKHSFHKELTGVNKMSHYSEWIKLKKSGLTTLGSKRYRLL